MPGLIKHTVLWILGCVFVHPSSVAQQLKLGNHPTHQTQSAVLDMESRNQGLLLTRIVDTNDVNVFHPPDGMIIFFTDGEEKEPYGENSGVYERVDGSWYKVRRIIDTAVDKSQTAIKFTHENSGLVLHIPNATSGLRGVVSSGHQTFSGRKTFKDSVRIKNLHPGSVLFIRKDANANNQVLTENNNRFFWDNTNYRLGIGTNNPNATLDVNGTFKLGTAGSIINELINVTYITSSLVQIAAKDNHLFSISKPEITNGGRVLVSPAEELPDGTLIAYGFTLNGTIKFKIKNTKSSSVAIPAGTKFYITVIQ